MRHDASIIQAAIKHLRRNDPILDKLIGEIGAFDLRLERNAFRMLVRSIISQQISTAAARSIRARLEALLAPAKITAEGIAALSLAQLRSVGLSSQKAGYLFDLSRKVSQKEVALHRFRKMSDEEVIAELIKVKGIGVWTAQMYLIFSAGRLDVFPHGDLGIRSAMRKLYGLAEMPSKTEGEQIAKAWRPYSSIASWYCWRSLDSTLKTPKT